MTHSATAVTEFMRALTLDAELAEHARACDAAKLRTDFGLSTVEAEAIVGRRIDILLDSGVHPVSLMQFARVFGFSLTERWAELAAEH